MAIVKQKLIMRGALGIRRDVLSQEQLDLIKSRLTLVSKPYKNNPPVTVQAFTEDSSFLWVPRYFNYLDFWDKVTDWQWVAPPLDYELASNFTLLPERKQPEAVAALEAHIRTHSAAIGVLPTGTGKTLVSLEVARRFKTPIGVLIYAGHQIDNWEEHITKHLGVPKQHIGYIKESVCDIGKPVTIISIQTVLSRELPLAAYEQFGFIVMDECHRAAAAMWGKAASRFPARYRLGISADPNREDGLDPIIRWNFGKVGYSLYTRPTGELPLVCLVRFPSQYPESKYMDWRQDENGRWAPAGANFQKYCKLLSKDKTRNTWIVDKIIEARSKGRAILVFAHHREHIKSLHDEFMARWSKLESEVQLNKTSVSLLWGGLKTKERKAAQEADITFTTHGFAREALNMPHLDTLIFATPPGNPLQPAGRLRDKGPTTRKSLLIIDPFELGDYPFKKAMSRKQSYEDLGMTVKRLST